MKNHFYIKSILTLFYSYMPRGVNFFSLTYAHNLDLDEWENMYHYLIKERLIEPTSKGDKQIITDKGIELMFY